MENEDGPVPRTDGFADCFPTCRNAVDHDTLQLGEYGGTQPPPETHLAVFLRFSAPTKPTNRTRQALNGHLRIRKGSRHGEGRHIPGSKVGCLHVDDVLSAERGGEGHLAFKVRLDARDPYAGRPDPFVRPRIAVVRPLRGTPRRSRAEQQRPHDTPQPASLHVLFSSSISLPRLQPSKHVGGIPVILLPRFL